MIDGLPQTIMDGRDMKIEDVPVTDVSTPELFQMLSSERRRNLIRYIDAADGWIGAREMAPLIADAEGASESAAYVSITQQHLPRLAKAGLIEHDSDTQQAKAIDTATAVWLIQAGRAGTDNSNQD